MSKLDLPPALYEALQRLVHGEHEGLRQRLVPAYAPFAGRPVLELGCGTGALSAFFPPGVYTGIDIDAARVRAGKKLHPGASLLVADAASLPPSFYAPFEFLFCHAWLHHLDDEACQAVFEAIRRASAARPKLLMAWEPVLPPFTRNPAGFLLGKLDRGDFVRPAEELERLCAPFVRRTVRFPGRWSWPVPGAELTLAFGDPPVPPPA